MSKPVIEVQIRGLCATSVGCAVFLGNEEKVFVMFVDQSVGTAIAIGLIYRVTSARIAADNGATWVVAIYCPLLGNLDIFVTGMATAYFVQAKRVEWPRLLHGLLLCGILYVSAAICWSKLLGSTDGRGIFSSLTRAIAASVN